jgi:hypothetical protein
VGRKGGAVNSYIVRIYRQKRNNPRILVGTIEEVGRTGKRAFMNVDDLWDILNARKKKTQKMLQPEVEPVNRREIKKGGS